jgi:hypothetical protein
VIRLETAEAVATLSTDVLIMNPRPAADYPTSIIAI